MPPENVCYSKSTYHFECFLRSQEVEHGLEMLLDVWATSAHTPAVVTTVIISTVAIGIVAGRRTQPLVRWKYQRSALPGEITLTETANKQNGMTVWQSYEDYLIHYNYWTRPDEIQRIIMYSVPPTFLLSYFSFITFVPLSPSLISPFTLISFRWYTVLIRGPPA